MKSLLFTSILVVVTFVMVSFQDPESDYMIKIGGDLTITILYDNYKFNEDLESDWGFSCLIEGPGKTILFDSGTKGSILMSNMKKMAKDPEDIDIVFLSHMHQDHTGGMSDFLEANPDVTVYMPVSFPDDFKEMIKSKGTDVKEVSGSLEIIDGVKSTGELGTEIIEQSLVINTEKGSIVITGCAHPGILDIIRKSTEISGNDILLVFGGFHLLRTNDKVLTETIEEFKNLNVRYAGPTHCSGDKTIKIFNENFGNNFIVLGAGKVLKLSELK